MPRLLLVRHAEAAVQASGGDRERPLTARGWADAARLGVYLRESGLIPDAALTSPARRAQDTLAAILQELPPSRPFIAKVESSLYCADADTLLGLLPGPGQPIETLLIVG
ncbi:MAG TPA: histidine phosphatase family protein, partial [Methylocella sp.]|nr:histidine phosphatase family protein [Methylocella sp.]